MFFSSSHINEAKRNTEHQVKMFEIIHEVDNCPVGYFLLEPFWDSNLHQTVLKPLQNVSLKPLRYFFSGTTLFCVP